MTTADIARIMRAHSQGHSPALLDSWLTYETLSRFREWVPPAPERDALLVDIGCYQPSIGYYEALGWRQIIGVAKEEGEGSVGSTYPTARGGTARIVINDVETEPLPIEDASADAVLMMEILEHFGLDPMQALAEANRVLKPGGLLILSTPNAASLANLLRIVSGRGPFTSLEFSGFSTNRHNRLYDAFELRKVIEAAGFTIETATSRSYRDTPPSLRLRLSKTIWRTRDAWNRFRSGHAIERGDYLFVRARKTSGVRDRHPAFLYFDPAQWPEWFQARRQAQRGA